MAVGRWAPTGGADQWWGGPTEALSGVGGPAVGQHGGAPADGGVVGRAWWAPSDAVGQHGGAPADDGVVVSGSTEWADNTFENESVRG
jgi:hypothetical protein